MCENGGMAVRVVHHRSVDHGGAAAAAAAIHWFRVVDRVGRF